ncbi:glutaredoxin family protein [Haloglycomyces albus]|uniref:glutaredoxin family protein n=1 Tax=Haloglycomyces albus TaxID=526067 RepID=UPI00046D82B1|nr:glutaredoxin family protein [Haloglycomyces albus]
MTVLEITLLTQEDCGFCTHAKEILGRLRADFSLTVTELDMTTESGRAMALEHGIFFAPGLFIDGEPFSYGRVSEKKLRKTFRKRVDEG